MEKTRRFLLSTLAAAALLAVFQTTAPGADCPGDCNGSGAVTASDIGRLIQTTLRCAPCPGNVPGGVAAGCDAFQGGCPAADVNHDGCIRASELSRVLRCPLLNQSSVSR